MPTAEHNLRLATQVQMELRRRGNRTSPAHEIRTRCSGNHDFGVMLRACSPFVSPAWAGLAVVHLRASSFKPKKKVLMNVNNVGTSPLSSLLNATLAQRTNTPSSIPPAGATAASAQISKPGELLQKLQQLQQQDPTQFKQVLTQLADNLQQVADQSGNSDGMAAKLATAFKNAADSGDLTALQTALQPPNVAAAAQAASSSSSTSAAGSSQGAQKHHHGHHHHGGGGIAAAFSTAFSQIDAALQSPVLPSTDATTVP